METLKKYSVTIQGITPLIMHCDKLCNPINPITKKMKEISSLRKKTDEHHLAMARIEWEAGLHWDDDIGLYMPSKCLRACIQASARKYKLGKCIKGLNLEDVLGTPILGYEKKTIEQLWNAKTKSGSPQHLFCESVVVNRGRIMRTRPIFNTWGVKFNLFLQIELLTEQQLRQIMDTAGFEYGLCELRPELATGSNGKFSVEIFKEIEL